MASEIEAFIREAARKRGIDPDVAVLVAKSEGGVDVPARRGTFPTGSSWWPMQLHYGGEGYEHLGTTAGQGNGFTALTGWQPGDPRAWRDSVRYALNRAKANGWGDWYGARDQGIVGFRGIDVNHSWDANAEPWDFETGGGTVPALSFNPDARVDAQIDAWSCSIQATEWLLRSIGRNPSDQWIEAQLLGQGIVTREHGLMDASGRALAEWLTREYGQNMGWVAQYAPVTFDDVAAGAGVNPTLVGGRTWGPSGHWSGVRRRAADGSLELANSVAGYTGVGPTMDRAEWDARGPWSAIFIDRMSTLPAPAPAPAPFDKALVAKRLREILALHDETAARIHGELAALLAQVEEMAA